MAKYTAYISSLPKLMSLCPTLSDPESSQVPASKSPSIPVTASTHPKVPVVPASTTPLVPVVPVSSSPSIPTSDDIARSSSQLNPCAAPFQSQVKEQARVPRLKTPRSKIPVLVRPSLTSRLKDVVVFRDFLPSLSSLPVSMTRARSVNSPVHPAQDPVLSVPSQQAPVLPLPVSGVQQVPRTKSSVSIRRSSRMKRPPEHVRPAWRF